MNERIRKLAVEAGFYALTNPDVEKFEKFALSIARECANLVQGVPTDIIGYYTADQKIKRHFGIEE